MHIGMISASFLPMVGGVEWKVHYLATEYVRRGHRVTVFTTRPGVNLGRIDVPVQPTYVIKRCSITARGFGKLGITRRLLSRAIRQEHARNPIDVMHCHPLGVPTRAAIEANKGLRIPIVATTYGGDVHVVPELGYGDRLIPWIDRMIREDVRRVDVIGSVSRSIRAGLEEMGTTARIVDIPNGVDWEQFQGPRSEWLRQRLCLKSNDAIILSVGRYNICKGYEHGIRAVRRVVARHPEAHYVIVGRMTNTLLPLIDDLGISKNAHIVEQVDMQQIPELFKSADIFFNPSLREGFAQVNAQALASGLPCVITDAPGNIDAADYGGAIVAKAADADSMADALLSLLTDEQKRSALGIGAQTGSHNYAWSCIAEKYLHIFEELRRAEPRER